MVFGDDLSIRVFVRYARNEGYELEVKTLAMQAREITEKR